MDGHGLCIIVRMDPVRQIKIYNAGRDPERLAIKYRKMRASPFAFLRGSCHLFYDRLPVRGLNKDFPLVWACGDLHLENFGSYKGDSREVYFDLNDFDEAALAPASWDLVRMLASIWLGAHDISDKSDDVRKACEVFLRAYCSALSGGKAFWVERDVVQGPARELLDGLRGRTRSDFLVDRTVLKGRKRKIRIDGRKALAATPAQHAMVTDFMATFASSQPNPGFYKVLDVARRIAGTGSLGVDRFAILVEGKGSPDGNYFLDLKRATCSSMAPHLKVKQPRWPSEAHRCVELQRRCQAVPMAFLHAMRLDGEPYVLRALQPSEDKVSFSPAELSLPELNALLATMGHVVAWSHLRSAGRQGSAIADELIDFGQRRKWQEKLVKAAQTCARQVKADAALFNAAYDAGAFDLS